MVEEGGGEGVGPWGRLKNKNYLKKNNFDIFLHIYRENNKKEVKDNQNQIPGLAHIIARIIFTSSKKYPSL